MNYLLALIGDESRMADRTPEERREGMRHWDAYTTELRDTGAFVAGEGLQPSATARTVKVGEDSSRTVTDGPFAETKEQLGGFYLIDCDDLDEALAWARKIPMPGGTVEVRPVMDYEAAGSQAHQNEAEARA